MKPFTDNFANLDNWIVSNWRAPGGGAFKPDHVEIAGGILRLKVTQDMLTSIGGEVQLKQTFGYGRYDFVMRASSTSPTPYGTGHAVSGQISSTWNFLPNANFDSLTEIDAPEIEGCNPNQLSFTVWENTLRVDHKSTPLLSPESQFHKYSFIWGAGKVEFLVDDKSVAAIVSPKVPTLAAHPMINHWGTNSKLWGGRATPGVTRYMYVRSFVFTPK